MNLIKHFFNYHKFAICLTVFIILFLSFLIPLFVHFLFKFNAPNEFFAAEWSAADMLTYIGTVFTIMGSSSFSVLALYQNKKISEYQKKYNDLCNRVEKQKCQPLFSILDSSILNGVGEIIIENKSENPAIELTITDFSFSSSMDNNYVYNCLGKNEKCSIKLRTSNLQNKQCFTFSLKYTDILQNTNIIHFKATYKEDSSMYTFSISEV